MIADGMLLLQESGAKKLQWSLGMWSSFYRRGGLFSDFLRKNTARRYHVQHLSLSALCLAPRLLLALSLPFCMGLLRSWKA